MGKGARGARGASKGGRGAVGQEGDLGRRHAPLFNIYNMDLSLYPEQNLLRCGFLVHILAAESVDLRRPFPIYSSRVGVLRASVQKRVREEGVLTTGRLQSLFFRFTTTTAREPLKHV